MYNTDNFRISRRQRASHRAPADVRAFIYPGAVASRIPCRDDKKAYLADMWAQGRFLSSKSK